MPFDALHFRLAVKTYYFNPIFAINLLSKIETLYSITLNKVPNPNHRRCIAMAMSDLRLPTQRQRLLTSTKLYCLSD